MLVTHRESVLVENQMGLALPADVEAVIRQYRTAELSTLARDGTPITWPVIAFFDAKAGVFRVTTSIALDQKARNVRRDGRVSLLFSNPRASGIAKPFAVLVQGDAIAPDEMTTSVAGMEDDLVEVFRRQPASIAYQANEVMRRVFDWYYMRLSIGIRPRRWLRFEPNAMGAKPTPFEVTDVP
jgi:hypothetical protein